LAVDLLVVDKRPFLHNVSQHLLRCDVVTGARVVDAGHLRGGGEKEEVKSGATRGSWEEETMEQVRDDGVESAHTSG
jgi:hypothetical protein